MNIVDRIVARVGSRIPASAEQALSGLSPQARTELDNFYDDAWQKMPIKIAKELLQAGLIKEDTLMSAHHGGQMYILTKEAEKLLDVAAHGW